MFLRDFMKNIFIKFAIIYILRMGTIVYKQVFKPSSNKNYLVLSYFHGMSPKAIFLQNLVLTKTVELFSRHEPYGDFFTEPAP